MSITAHRATSQSQRPPQETLLPLEAGDHLDQPTFHARYEAMPPGFRAELIRGVVVVPSPLGDLHGRAHPDVITWLGVYRSRTPGTILRDNATLILGPDSEAQPDAEFLIAPECGGRTRPEGIYRSGVPELIVEVASSSASYDLHSKRPMYEAAGVPEYVVVVLCEARLVWLRLDAGRYVEVAPDADGLIRSLTFPGLWLDPDALLRGDIGVLLQVLGRGLATPEHAAFVQELQGRRAGPPPQET